MINVHFLNPGIFYLRRLWGTLLMNQDSTNHFYSEDDLRNVLRQIGSQYTMWTRFLLVSTASDIGDQEVLENRLYEVVRDFTNVLLVYYDKTSVEKIDTIARSHIKLIISLIDTLLFQSEEKGNEAIAAVQNSSKEMAAALHELNPYLDESTLTNSFIGLVSFTVDQIMKRKSKQYALDVYQYNFIEYQILMIADYIWEGFLHAFYS